jgi:hypothetical protein
MYIPNFIKIGSDIQKLIGGYTDTQTAWRSHKPSFIFQNKESGLKNSRNESMKEGAHRARKKIMCVCVCVYIYIHTYLYVSVPFYSLEHELLCVYIFPLYVVIV